MQQIPLNHYIHACILFNLNDLKFQKSCSKKVKKGFFNQNLGTLQTFRLKSGQNAEINHTNHIKRTIFPRS